MGDVEGWKGSAATIEWDGDNEEIAYAWADVEGVEHEEAFARHVVFGVPGLIGKDDVVDDANGRGVADIWFDHHTPGSASGSVERGVLALSSKALGASSFARKD